ncbi:MAG TPA: homoserine dehydrogenase [Chloroflexota bacterium]|nr:homoserine dehydrogenase [Chloroflexota bacterium]
MKSSVEIGLLGAGVVGGGTYEVLTRKSDQITEQVGVPVRVRRVLVRDLEKIRETIIPAELLTTRAEDILEDPEIDVVVEVMGGEEPARTLMMAAIESGKHVVTANKEVIAKFGFELMRMADERGVDLFFEASVGGGIPIIRVLRRDLLANDITAIQAIINGTTNYILTEMERGQDYLDALRHAQRLGYAEADPRNDVQGIDAAYKLAILASLAFRAHVRPSDIRHAGIEELQAKDFRYAQEMGYVIKLIAMARLVDDEIEVAVHPMLIPRDHHLASVKGVYNAVLIEGDQIDQMMLYGRGAGAKPTASAVLADLGAVARNIVHGNPERLGVPRNGRRVRHFDEMEARFYIRMQVADKPGVLARISQVLGDEGISIASVIQKETDETARVAELVIMTHAATERRVAEAIQLIRTLPITRAVNTFIRVAR